MAILSINVPDAMVPEVFDALKWKYPEVDITGLAMGAAARKIVRRMLAKTYEEYKVALDNTSLLTDYNTLLAAAKAAASSESNAIV